MIFSPYPGLRPFKEEESEYFFGREEHIEGLLAKLSKNRFLAAVGPSGCGKSSLVYAGMIPALKMGFMPGAGENWRVAALRPGASPMRNLAESLHRALALPDAPGPDSPADDTAVAFLSAALRRGPSRLAETFREARLPDDVRLLVLVDQFEEIFRFRDQTDADEADAFVELLLAPERAAEGRIYVALTMRSDFLGDCAVFRGLPEAMNDSQFLTPRLTREQRRAAIAGPAGVQGTVIEPALVNRMLNEMGDDPDQLPLMQHCLMRMWTLADGGPLTTEHYEKAGGLERALSKHADDVFQKLTPEQKRIAEVLFKRLSERSEGKRDTRRPVRLKEPAEVAGVAPEKVAEVVEAFRAPGRSFLTPPPPKALEAERVVDISHESLIRQWDRLREWARQEAESADSYRRLEDTALLREKGDAALWRTPDLENALRWRDRQNPTPAWARRYGEHFDLAMAFLEESETEQKASKEAEEKRQREKLRRTRIQLALALAGLLIAAGLAFWGFWERGRADTARQRAVTTEQARTNDLFESRLVHASLLAKGEDYAAARDILNQTRELDPDTPPDRRHARDLLAWYVDLSGGTADKVYEGAEAKLLDVAVGPDGDVLAAVGERGTVVLFDEKSGDVVARLAGHETDPSVGQEVDVWAAVFHPDGDWLATAGDDRRIILWSMPEGEKSNEWEAPDRVVALAVSPDGKVLASGGTDDDVTLWNVETGEKTNTLKGHQDSVSGLAFSPDGSLLASASYDRTARIWDVETGQAKFNPFWHPDKLGGGIAFHPEKDLLVAGCCDRRIHYWDTATGREIGAVGGHSNFLTELSFIDGGRRLVSASMDRTLRIWDVDTGVALRVMQGHAAGVIGVAVFNEAVYSAANDGTVRRWKSGTGDLRVADLPSEPASSAISPDGSTVAIGFANGHLGFYSLVDQNRKWLNENKNDARIMRLAFSPDGELLASACYADNTVKLWRTEDGELLQTFEGHANAVHAAAFSPDGKLVASASYDGRIGLFEPGAEKGKFFEAYDGKIGSVVFGKESETLLSAGADGAVRLWNIRTWPPEPVGEFPKSGEMVIWAALSPDGSRIAAVGRDLLVHVYDTETGEEEHAFVGHEQAVYRAAFSQDGGQVATVSSDATVRFWDLKTKSELFKIDLPSRKYPPVPLWDFSFQCTPEGDCHVAVPLTQGRLALYRMKGVYKP